MLNALIIFQKDSAEMMPLLSSAEVRSKESSLFVDVSGCVAAVAHRNFYGEVELFSYFFSFFSPAFSPVILNPKPLQRRVVLFNQPNSKSKSRRWRDCIMQKIYVVNLKREITVNEEI